MKLQSGQTGTTTILFSAPHHPINPYRGDGAAGEESQLGYCARRGWSLHVLNYGIRRIGQKRAMLATATFPPRVVFPA